MNRIIYSNFFVIPARLASLLAISAISSFNSFSLGFHPNSLFALTDLQLAPKFQTAGPAYFLTASSSTTAASTPFSAK